MSTFLADAQKAWGVPVQRTEKRSTLIPLPRGTGAGRPVPRSTPNDELLEAYELNTWVMRAVNIIATKVAEIPLVVLRPVKGGKSKGNAQRNYVYRRGFMWDTIRRQRLSFTPALTAKSIFQEALFESVESDHPLAELLAHINPEEDPNYFMEEMTAFLALNGNTYIHEVRGAGEEKPPTDLYVIPPNLVRIVPGLKERKVEGYLVGNNLSTVVPVLADDFIHTRFFNPRNQFFGMGPLQAAREGLVADISAAKYNRKFFENDATPKGVIVVDDELSAPEIEALQERLTDGLKGVDNSHRWVILDNRASYEQIGLSHIDMSFLEQRKFSKMEILAVFGVPPVMVEDLENASYANADIQRRIFYENTLLTYIAKIESRLNAGLASEYEDDVIIVFDISAVQALQEDLEKKYTIAQKALTAGETLNDVRRDVLGRSAVPGGNVVLQPAQLIPIAFDINDGGGTESFTGSESKVPAPVGNYALNRKEELKEWEDAMVPVWMGIVTDVGNQTIEEVGDPDTETPELQITQRVHDFTAAKLDVLGSVEDHTQSQLNDVYDLAVSEDWSTDQLTNAVENLYVGFETVRAGTIIFHDVVSSINFARQEAYQQSTSVDRKRWITTLDGFQRDTHDQAHGQVVAVTESFKVGSALLAYPAQPGAPIEEIANCRCTTQHVRTGFSFPEPGIVTEADKRYYKLFIRQAQHLARTHRPKVEAFFRGQKERVIQRIREVANA